MIHILDIVSQKGGGGESTRRNHQIASPAIRDDLRSGLTALPIWIQELLREPLADTGGGDA